MVEPQPSKLMTRVRFPLPAPLMFLFELFNIKNGRYKYHFKKGWYFFIAINKGIFIMEIIKNHITKKIYTTKVDIRIRMLYNDGNFKIRRYFNL